MDKQQIGVETFGKLVKTTHTTASRWCNGDSKPTGTNLNTIQEILALSPEDIKERISTLDAE